MGAPLSGCSDKTELAALESAVRERELALAERQALAQNLGALNHDVAELEREVEGAGGLLQPQTAADAVRPHLPQGVALDVAEGGKRLVIWGGGGAPSLTEVAERLARHVPLAVAESAEISAPHYRLELVVGQVEEAAPQAERSSPRSFTQPPPTSWRSGSKSRELRARLEQMERQLAELGKVLGGADELVAKRRDLEQRKRALAGLDRAGEFGPLLARAVSAGQLTQAVFGFSPGSMVLEIREGGDVAELAKVMQEEGMKVSTAAGPPARVELSRP